MEGGCIGGQRGWGWGFLELLPLDTGAPPAAAKAAAAAAAGAHNGDRRREAPLPPRVSRDY